MTRLNGGCFSASSASSISDSLNATNRAGNNSQRFPIAHQTEIRNNNNKKRSTLFSEQHFFPIHNLFIHV